MQGLTFQERVTKRLRVNKFVYGCSDGDSCCWLDPCSGRFRANLDILLGNVCKSSVVSQQAEGLDDQTGNGLKVRIQPFKVTCIYQEDLVPG